MKNKTVKKVIVGNSDRVNKDFWMNLEMYNASPFKQEIEESFHDHLARNDFGVISIDGNGNLIAVCKG